MEKFRNTSEQFHTFKYNKDNHITKSYSEQSQVEENVETYYSKFKMLLQIDNENEIPELLRIRHTQFLLKGLVSLPESYSALDSSRAWLCYWILHGITLLDIKIEHDQKLQIIDFLTRCQNSDGGYGGGPGQYSHLAPTYAAINSLCILGIEEAYQSINRQSLYKYLLSMKCEDGGFLMHKDGEEDIRGAYCATSVARLVNIATPEMFDGTAEWIVSCQTYEGGFGGYPGMEAHGGYSFCALATLVLLGKEILCDYSSLLRWTAMRQLSYEGGFNGRTNKLVDGCYSFWQGGLFPILHTILTKQGDNALSSEFWMFHQKALQEYLLICCQHPNGGLIDKPDKARDYYHTCYCLSGLSVSQHFEEGKLSNETVIGHQKNKLRKTHPLFNICIDFVDKCHEYFSQLPLPS